MLISQASDNMTIDNHTAINDLSHLFTLNRETLENGSFYLLNNFMLEEIRKLTNYTQLRFNCYKKAVGRQIDIATERDSRGSDVVNFFKSTTAHGTASNYPSACRSFYRLPRDTSLISRKCNLWGTGESGNWAIETVNHMHLLPLYNRTFFVPYKYHFIVYTDAKSRECDDYGTNFTSDDFWRIYVR